MGDYNICCWKPHPLISSNVNQKLQHNYFLWMPESPFSSHYSVVSFSMLILVLRILMSYDYQLTEQPANYDLYKNDATFILLISGT